jgi:hypothetical protein
MRRNSVHRSLPAMLAALLTALLLAASPWPSFGQGVPGGGIGPTPAPTPGQSISIGPGSLGGGIGPAPAPTPGQSISLAPGNLGGGVGPAPAPTPGQSFTFAPNTKKHRGRGATPRLAPDLTVNPPPTYMPTNNGGVASSPGLRQTFTVTGTDKAQVQPGETARPRRHAKKCLHDCARVPPG